MRGATATVVLVYVVCWLPGGAWAQQEEQEPEPAATDEVDPSPAPEMPAPNEGSPTDAEPSPDVEPTSGSSEPPDDELTEEQRLALERERRIAEVENRERHRRLQEAEIRQLMEEQRSDAELEMAAEVALDAAQRQLHASMVRYETSWGAGFGFLVGDARTVVLLMPQVDADRPIWVRRRGASGPEQTLENILVTRHGQGGSRIVVGHTEADMDGTPLPVSLAGPAVGDSLFLLVSRGPSNTSNNHECAQAAVTAISHTTVTLGTASGHAAHGTAVINADGEIVALMGRNGYAVRTTVIFDQQYLRPRPMAVMPMWGARIGTEFGAPMDTPLTVDLDVGVSVWDQLGITLSLGFAINRDAVLGIGATDERGQGLVEASQGAFNLGFAFEYRFALRRASLPIYLDVSLGLQYSLTVTNPQGLAFYAADPGCTLGDDACDLVLGSAPDRVRAHYFGAAVGADLRLGGFVVSYRFIPEVMAYRFPNTHRLSFGITIY